jgi:hypothetical protein
MSSNQIKEVPFCQNAIDDMLQNSTSFENAYNYLFRFTKEQLITILPNKLNISFTKENCILILCKKYGFKASKNFEIDDLSQEETIEIKNNDNEINLKISKLNKKLHRFFTLRSYCNHLVKTKKQSFNNWFKNENKLTQIIEELVIITHNIDKSKLTITKKSPYLKYIEFKENILNTSIDTNNQSTNKEELKDLLNHIETSISEYDNELKHTVNGKKEYVFKDNEFVGEGTLKFIPKAQSVINKNKYTYDLFIKLLDIKFPNILIIEATPFILHYKLKGKLNV